MRPTPLARPWSPYLVGAAIGALSWFSFATADRPLGITTAFEHTAALVGEAAGAAPDAYLTQKRGEGEPPKIGWEWMLVVGVFFGAYAAASLSRDREPGTVPEPWARRFGPSRAKRLLAAFAGGAVMMFGARLAGGCTSGHAISGTLQLAASSWIFSVVMGISAVAAASLLYGREARSDG